MPIYEYECKECGVVHDVLVKKVTDRTEERVWCEKCESITDHVKLMSRPNHIYKGSGFYATDYKPKPAGKTGAEK